MCVCVWGGGGGGGGVCNVYGGRHRKLSALSSGVDVQTAVFLFCPPRPPSVATPGTQLHAGSPEEHPDLAPIHCAHC